MKHRNSHFAVGYWGRIRRGRPAPDQSDIDPRALKRLLPFVFLLEARPAGNFVYRLAGTKLCERFGGELRGSNFLKHWDDESRGRLQTLLRQALTLKMPVCLTAIGATEDCRMIESEIVLMPITFGSSEPDRFLGVAQVLTDVTSLDGRPVTFERLTTGKLVREDENATSEPPPPPAAGDGRRGHVRAPYLRLVSSNEAREDPLRFDIGEALERFHFSLNCKSALRV
jgi:hypothetical protein